MSKMVPLYGFGGGASLNFSVKRYDSEDKLPSTAAINTIAVISEKDISGYTFSAVEPENIEDGLVWFSIDPASTISFSATKKNPIMIHLDTAKQYISDSWDLRQARIYTASGWTQFGEFDIFVDGQILTESGFATYNSTNTTDSNGSIMLKTTANKVSESYVEFGPLSLTGVNELTMTYSLASASTSNSTVVGVIFVSTEKVEASGTTYENIETGNISTNTLDNIKKDASSGEISTSLNVSNLSGDFYVYCGTHTQNAKWANVRTFTLIKLSAT